MFFIKLKTFLSVEMKGKYFAFESRFERFYVNRVHIVGDIFDFFSVLIMC